MNVEIAICTFNRCRLLDRTLSRLAEIDASACNSLTIIVVENNCTDETSNVLRRHAERLPIVSLQEPRQGQVFARNKAIKVAKGDLLIWIDDDVSVGDDWLSSYVHAAQTLSRHSFWGGPIRPIFEAECPSWIAENWDKLCGCFAERELGDVTFEFTAERLPYGANFAIRTDIQKQHPFSENLGRTDNVVLGEDELTLMRTLLSSGYDGAWLPEAGIDHLIDADRTTTDYVGNYFRGQGRALAIKGQTWTDDVAALEKEMKHELACFRAKRWFTKSDVWLSHLLRGSLAAGQLEAVKSLN